jgi:hypothetical protein
MQHWKGAKWDAQRPFIDPPPGPLRITDESLLSPTQQEQDRTT